MNYAKEMAEAYDSAQPGNGGIAALRVVQKADAELSRLRADCERKNELLKEAMNAVERHQPILYVRIYKELKEPHAT